MRLIIFSVGTRTGESNVLSQTITVKGSVDKFTAIIRIKTEKREG